MSIVIGNSLSRNPIFKKRILKGKKVYEVAPEEFIELLEAKAFLKPIKEMNDEDRGVSGDRGRGKQGITPKEEKKKPKEKKAFNPDLNLSEKEREEAIKKLQEKDKND
jgi:hypothetical protein